MITASTIIVSITEPLAYKDGSFWYDLTNSKLMLRKNGVWENAVSADKIDLTDIENAIANLDGRLDIIEAKNFIEFKVVPALPTIAEANPGAIYLVSNGKTGSKNVYDEYILVTKEDGTRAFEVVGSTAVELDGYMKNDGSNYVTSKELVTPVITSTWTIKDASNNTMTAPTGNSITVEPGATVTWSGYYTNPTLTGGNAGKASPTSCRGDFGTTLPSVGSNSETNTFTTTTNKTYTIVFQKPKSGLLVENSKVVKAEGTDEKSAQASVSFANKVYWGVNAATILLDDTIKAMSSQFASTGAIGSKTFACTANQYCYICMPSSYPTPTINYGTTVVGFVEAGTTNITNTSGKSIEYKCLRSGQKYSETMTFKFS